MFVCLCLMSLLWMKDFRCGSEINPKCQDGCKVREQEHPFLAIVAEINKIMKVFYEARAEPYNDLRYAFSSTLLEKYADLDLCDSDDIATDVMLVMYLMEEIFKYDFQELVKYAEENNKISVNELVIFLWDLMVEYRITGKKYSIWNIKLHESVRRRLNSLKKPPTYSDVLLAKVFNHVYDSEMSLQRITWFFNSFKSISKCAQYNNPSVIASLKEISRSFQQSKDFSLILSGCGGRNKYIEYKGGSSYLELLEGAIQRYKEKCKDEDPSLTLCILFGGHDSENKEVSLEFFLFIEILRKADIHSFMLSNYLSYFPGSSLLDEMVVYDALSVSKHAGECTERSLPFVFDNAFTRVLHPDSKTLESLNDLVCVRGGEAKCHALQEVIAYYKFKQSVTKSNISSITIRFMILGNYELLDEEALIKIEKDRYKAKGQKPEIYCTDIFEVYSHIEPSAKFIIEIVVKAGCFGYTKYQREVLVKLLKNIGWNDVQGLPERISVVFSETPDSNLSLPCMIENVISSFYQTLDGKYLSTSAACLRTNEETTEFLLTIRDIGFVPKNIFVNNLDIHKTHFGISKIYFDFVVRKRGGFVCKEVQGRYFITEGLPPHIFYVNRTVLHFVGKKPETNDIDIRMRGNPNYVSTVYLECTGWIDKKVKDSEIVRMGWITEQNEDEKLRQNLKQEYDVIENHHMID